MTPPSDNVRAYLRFATIIPGIAVILFPLLCRFVSESTALILICVCCILSGWHAQAMQKEHPEEIRPKEFPMRLRAFGIMKKQVSVMFVVYAVVGVLSKNLVIWIYSGALLALSLVFLIHEKIEVDELRKKEPNQPPEPTAMSVTPPAAQEPRQP